MRVFVTGASGFIGSAVVPELIDGGHQVVGLARSEASAHALASVGAEVLRGDLEDLDALATGAAASDGVIHLAYIHDFARFEAAARTDRQAIEALATAFEGSNRPLVIASGILGLAPGRVATERDVPDGGSAAAARLAGVQTALAFASRGVRSSIVRLAPCVHGVGDHGFIATLIGIARAQGVSGYIGDGTNHWPAIHRLDAAKLFRLALEKAAPGAALHAIADEGLPIRSIAEVIGRHLDLPVRPVSPENASEHFGWIARFLAVDVVASNALTRETFAWEPTQPGLIEDLEEGHYFRGVSP